uniref:C2H2-type domain-containing protein n=1 Tax=Cyclopterus lumpus TaxID=8103 RepID=A0A8C2XE06_CYCLU
MSKVQQLRCLVNQRLTAAAQEILGLFERTIAEYEEELCSSREENERHRKRLDAVFNPEVRLQRAGWFSLFLYHFKLMEPVLEEEDPEPPHIKEEQEDPEPPHIKEELWTSQEGDQLPGLEQAGFTFSFTPVKSEDDEEEAQSSQLHQRQTGHMETEAEGEDCGGPEPDRNSDPDDCDDWKETREPQSGLNSLNNDEVHVSDSKCSSGEKPLSCSECGKKFHLKGVLNKHMRIHTREKPFSCSVCKTSFTQSGTLKGHMLTHTGEKPFSCSVCEASFISRGHLKCHMLTHTREKPFSCSVCEQSFKRKSTLKRHMLTHTEEKPFSCSVCDQSFKRKANLKRHMLNHTGEKPFSCSVCEASFFSRGHLKGHICKFIHKEREKRR